MLKLWGHIYICILSKHHASFRVFALAKHSPVCPEKHHHNLTEFPKKQKFPLYVCASVCLSLHVHVRRPEVDVRYLPHFLYTAI